MTMSTFWVEHPQAVSTLCKLFADGLTMSQISGEIGVSRNAVIGKIHRLNLARTTGFVPRRPPRPQWADEPPNRRRVRKRSAPASALVETPPPPPVDATLALTAGHARKQLTDLVVGECRWPLEGADCFCAEPQLFESSYCPYHHRRGHEPVRERKRWRS